MIDDTPFYAKAQIYWEKGIAVHVVRDTGDWNNGIIIEWSVEFFILDEFKKGRMVIFYPEIVKLETYTPLVR